MLEWFGKKEPPAAAQTHLPVGKQTPGFVIPTKAITWGKRNWCVFSEQQMDDRCQTTVSPVRPHFILLQYIIVFSYNTLRYKLIASEMYVLSANCVLGITLLK